MKNGNKSVNTSQHKTFVGKTLPGDKKPDLETKIK